MAKANNNKNPSVRIPTTAVYTTGDNGVPIQIHAEYATVQADNIAKVLLGHFNIPTDDKGMVSNNE